MLVTAKAEENISLKAMIEFTHIHTYINERAHTQARRLDGTRKIELQEETLYFYCVYSSS